MNGRRQKRLDRRRADFYRLRAQGKSLPEVIDVISTAYHASETALYKDWERRDTWGDYVIPESQDTFLVQDVLNRLNELRREFWEIVNDEAAETKDKIRALAKLVDLEMKILDASQSFGFANDKLEHASVDDDNVERLHQAVIHVVGEDNETEEKVARILLEYARKSEN
jgi:hypothetical protein